MMSSLGGSATTHRRLALLWFVLGCCLYLPALDYSFFADDEFYLAFSNTQLRELPLASLHELLVRPANPWEFLPVRDFSYWLDLQVFGDDGFGLHLTNLLVYVCSAFAASALLRAATADDAVPVSRFDAVTLAALGGCFFLLHPAHVEAAVWIASRKDLLAGTFSLAMLTLLVNAVRHAYAAGPLFFSWLLFVLACFSKSTAVTMLLPATALLLEGVLRGEFRPYARRTFVTLSAYWAVAILALAIHLYFGSELGIRVENSPGLAAGTERASRILASLVGLLLVPVNLGLIYDVYALGAWHWAVSSLTLLATGGAFYAVLIGRREHWPLAMLIMISPMLPYLQLAPFSTWSMASDRFVFVSVAGLALLLFPWLRRMRWQGGAFGILTILFIVLASLTWLRVVDWRSEQALYERDFERIPTHYLAARNYLISVLMPVESADIPRVIENIAREDARPFLSLLVDVSFANRRARSAGIAPEGSPGYCEGVRRLYALHAEGSARLRSESDMSFGNLLRSVDRYLYYSLGNPRRVCHTAQEEQVK